MKRKVRCHACTSLSRPYCEECKGTGLRTIKDAPPFELFEYLAEHFPHLLKLERDGRLTHRPFDLSDDLCHVCGDTLIVSIVSPGKFGYGCLQCDSMAEWPVIQAVV